MAIPAITSLCDALLPYLKTGGTTDAERHFLSYTERTNLATRRITVVPKNMRIDDGSRIKSRIEYEVGIHVEQEIDPADDATIASLVATSESIFNLWADENGALREQLVADCKWAGTVEFDLDQIYDVDTLRDDRMFSSVILIRYTNINQ